MLRSPALEQVKLNILADIAAELPLGAEISPILVHSVNALHPDTVTDFLLAGEFSADCRGIPHRKDGGI